MHPCKDNVFGGMRDTKEDVLYTRKDVTWLGLDQGLKLQYALECTIRVLPELQKKFVTRSVPPESEAHLPFSARQNHPHPWVLHILGQNL
jgi:hypothetical protein